MSKEKVLNALIKAGKPLKSGEIVEITGLNKKEVDIAMKHLKNEKAIVSPIRCYWEPSK